MEENRTGPSWRNELDSDLQSEQGAWDHAMAQKTPEETAAMWDKFAALMKDRKPYRISVQDRIDLDGDEKFSTGTREYETLDEAIDATKDIIDAYLLADFRKNPNDRPLSFFDSWIDFGYWPYIIGPDGDISTFRHREWAERRCYELTGTTHDPSGNPVEPTGRPVPEVGRTVGPWFGRVARHAKGNRWVTGQSNEEVVRKVQEFEAAE